ncbi:cysteine desulfurase family protein [Aliivibrio fischeri]|uniref:cysteine desulfurase n=1 Tax=Aliivibrio fischeri TaxID=668 RepID=A0A510UPE3_ALIFS|nr:cysteine desulfurase family protein [Aliivibrio fischeri]GEK14725.1 cysteine desulfurase IscS [Aliivibrio fischeri]
MYLDYLASTPINENALNAMVEASRNCYGNPSSNHNSGRLSRKLMLQAQKSIADSIGAEPSEIIFTSGATESNNLAIFGLAKLNIGKGKHLITSSIEHSCVLNIFNYLEHAGFQVTYLDPTSDGTIDIKSVKEAIKPTTTLISIMHVNNELGTINPIREIGKLCLENGIAFHTDAAQSVGKLSIEVLDDNLDALSASAHKFFGPKGVGFLYLRNARFLNIEPIIHGSGQQNNIRGGTIPTPLIIGMSTALKEFRLDNHKLTELKTLFLKQLDNCGISYTINGMNTLSNVINLTFGKPEDYATYTSQLDICVSQGSACNSNSVVASHVLTALGLTTDESFRTARISFYDETLLASADIFKF